MVSLDAHWKRSMKAALGEEARNGAIAATRGMKLGTERAKELLRAQVRGAGLGTKVANAVRSQAFPRSGTSLNAAGSIWSNAPHIMTAFQNGATIRARNGSFLTIPTRQCPKGARGRRHITYSEAVNRFGPPRGIPISGGYLALFPAVTGKTGRFRRAGKKASADRQNWVPFFILLRTTRVAKRLDANAVIQQVGRELPGLVAASWPGGVS